MSFRGESFSLPLLPQATVLSGPTLRKVPVTGWAQRNLGSVDRRDGTLPHPPHVTLPRFKFKWRTDRSEVHQSLPATLVTLSFPVTRDKSFRRRKVSSTVTSQNSLLHLRGNYFLPSSPVGLTPDRTRLRTPRKTRVPSRPVLSRSAISVLDSGHSERYGPSSIPLGDLHPLLNPRTTSVDQSLSPIPSSPSPFLPPVPPKTCDEGNLLGTPLLFQNSRSTFQ